MSCITLKNWVMSNAQLNADCLSNKENKLSLDLQFSTVLPKETSDIVNSVIAKLKVTLENGDLFFSIDVVANYIFSLTGSALTENEKDLILKSDAFPEVYGLLCKCVKNLLTGENIKEITMPSYSDIAASL